MHTQANVVFIPPKEQGFHTSTTQQHKNIHNLGKVSKNASLFMKSTRDEPLRWCLRETAREICEQIMRGNAPELTRVLDVSAQPAEHLYVWNLQYRGGGYAFHNAHHSQNSKDKQDSGIGSIAGHRDSKIRRISRTAR